MAMVVDRRVRVVAEGRDDFARKVAALVDAEEGRRGFSRRSSSPAGRTSCRWS